MTDPRIQKLARLLVHYSLTIRPGETFLIDSDLPGEELAVEVYKEGIQAGAHATIKVGFPQANEIYYRHASDSQLAFVSPIMSVYETYDRILSIFASQNTRALSGTDPTKRAKWLQANKTWFKLMNAREGRGEWCSTLFPTHASAQQANMSLGDFEDFVFQAGMLDREDPIAEWKALGTKMRVLTDWLKGRDKVILKGSDVDLEMSIKDRIFHPADGKANFPDGEVSTSPVENTANGWIRFRYPAIVMGQEVTNIQMWFENGRVVKETADKGQEVLTALLNTDAGSRYLGELAVGTNYNVTRVTGNMLFDEKMGGTIHVALGEGFVLRGGKNESGLHWDILCDMHQGEITVDGELFYRNGWPVLWDTEN
jgi:aminopeptidase